MDAVELLPEAVVDLEVPEVTVWIAGEPVLPLDGDPFSDDAVQRARLNRSGLPRKSQDNRGLADAAALLEACPRLPHQRPRRGLPCLLPSCR